MFVIALALLAEAASPSGSPRKALSDCLNALVDPAVKAGTKPNEFVEQAKQACAAQKAALQQFLAKEDKTVGMTAAAADADAAEQVQDLVDRVKDKFQDWFDNNKKG